jgi:predicted metal-binding membrane protein
MEITSRARDGDEGVRLRGPAIAWLLVVTAAAVYAAWRLGSAGGSMPGGMPASAALFVGVWTLMMAAMMLPAMTPVAHLYLSLGDAAAPRRERVWRVAGLVGGYLACWALVGFGALLVVRGATRLADARPGLAHVAAAVTIAGCGLYQLSPLKDRCLAHCRSPLGVIAHAARHEGPLRHLRAGVYHAGWCIGCCWTLMLALVMLGAMQLVWMLAFVAVLVLEKTWRHGRRVAVVAGVALLVLGVAVLFDSSLAGILDTGAMEAM